MSLPQSKRPSPEEARAQDRLKEVTAGCPFSLEDLRTLKGLFQDPGWLLFSRYREGVRKALEHRLHDTRMADAALFPLRQAQALGEHKTQDLYEGIEEEVEAMIDAYLKVRNGDSK